MENGPWIHTKNVGLLSSLFILLNIIIIIVLFVNHGRGIGTTAMYRWRRTWIFQSWEYTIFSAPPRIQNVYSYLYCIIIIYIQFTLLLFIGTILTIWPLRISLPSCCWALWTSSDRQWYILNLASGMYNICSLT